ncbi:C-type lectin domain-containing protein [Caenorhabditis elegans]|uniref:C-type lectin domain-containing protein n=1 Tax=Caenorhabditis elegans TaxID=6239 RepID=Q19516_CAEEL|nr:C-type lectin domain-containing protein [Caenorhabditis elegans]CAA96627.1 C-type lectin domain-containing protein [Caenorhabditis elegans]|eukprot:NP_505795.1 C-type LECtin [Caenorhabditis elegans]
MVHSFSVLLVLGTLFYYSQAQNAAQEVKTQVPKCNLWQGKCPPGWKTFIRPPGVRICLKIINQNATYLEAQNICRKQYNSRIHGIENKEEHNWVKMKSRLVIKQGASFMWVGARRKSWCYKTEAQLKTDDKCKSGLNSFEWDDQLTDGSYLFTQWDKTISAPEGIMSNNAPEDCVVMNVHEGDAPIDDKDCSLPQAGVLCGMTA